MKEGFHWELARQFSTPKAVVLHHRLNSCSQSKICKCNPWNETRCQVVSEIAQPNKGENSFDSKSAAISQVHLLPYVTNLFMQVRICEIQPCFKHARRWVTAVLQAWDLSYDTLALGRHFPVFPHWKALAAQRSFSPERSLKAQWLREGLTTQLSKSRSNGSPFVFLPLPSSPENQSF